MSDFFLLAGLLIGIGIVLPGVSGGVIAVILNVYDKIIFAVNDFHEDKRSNAVFLFKIFFGVIAGTIVSANLLSFFFERYLVEVSYLFIGLVIGTVPLLINNYKEKCNEKLNYFVLFVVMSISIFLSIGLKESLGEMSRNTSLFILLLAGFLFALGKVVPGLSSSIMLNIIGKYDLFLSLFSNPINFIFENTYEFIIILIGLIVGIIVSIKIMSFCLMRYCSITYSVIIGFVLGSVIVMYPGVVSFAGILFFLIGLVLSLGLPLLKK